MSWYEEKISIKRGTLFQAYAFILLTISMVLMASLISVFIFEDVSKYPEFWLYTVVVIEQFLLSFGLCISLQND